MSAKDVLKLMKDKEIEFVDLRFTDPRGKLQHLTMDATIVDDEMLEEGVFFDGSSIAGWKAINESDMILKPDLDRPIIDPFNSHNTVNIFCAVLDAVKKENIYAFDSNSYFTRPSLRIVEGAIQLNEAIIHHNDKYHCKKSL